MNWQTVIGFEVHVELGTKSKMFCGCPADHFGKLPNTQTCPACLGLPGALPVPNSKAIEWCIKLGLALGCQINLTSKFDRKNYFYPDLPKGYQISQYDQPFCYAGQIKLSSGKIIRITRVHMEEDTAKLQHAEVNGDKVTLVDFNRSGVPLVEIVTEPDFSDTTEAVEYLKEIQLIVRSLGISQADMEKGSMRLEANISVRPQGQTELPNFKVEVKNVNSFRFIKKAIDFEVTRQIEILTSGNIPVQETRGFNETKGETVSQRLKENAHEYRYFPEPDIPPLVFTSAQIENWKSQLPPLPETLRQTLIVAGINEVKANILVSDPIKFDLYSQLISQKYEVVKAAEMVINAPAGTTNILKLIALDSLKKTIAVDPEKISAAVTLVLQSNPKAISDYKAGKEQSLFFLIGQIKRSLGNVDTSLIKTEIISQIGE